MKVQVALGPDVRVEARLLMAGRRAGVARHRVRGHLEAGGGEFELEFVVFSIMDEGRVTFFEVFEADDAASAVARFEEIGARTEYDRLLARLWRARTARDWDAVSDCYPHDYEMVDRRALGWAPQRGRGAMAAFFRSWDDVVPDIDFWCEALAGNDEHSAARIGGRGHALDGGGAMEYDAITVATVRDGRIVRDEIFEAGDEAGALARLAELAD